MSNSALFAASTEGSPPKKYFVNFNQDFTSLAVGNKYGYRLYELSNADNIEHVYEGDPAEPFIIERLFNSSLVAVVSLSAPRKLVVCHFKKYSEICNYSYSNSIVAVKLNRTRLIVVLEESLYIHNIRDMKVLHTIRDTPPNPAGLCALSTSGDMCLIAYPGSSTSGQLQIFDGSNLHSKLMIFAHNSPLAAIAFSPCGTKVATASEKGTVIRVSSTEDGTKLYEFRRGVKRCVRIACLSFSNCGEYLACSSNTETVHVFKLDSPLNDSGPGTDESTWVGYLSSYLPTQVTDVFKQGRAFATAYLPYSDVGNVLGINTLDGKMRLMVATDEGLLYIFNMDPNESSILNLYKKHYLDGRDPKKECSTTQGVHLRSDPISIDDDSDSDSDF
ncbi:hypothetical protein WA026_000173 [Henosepilachna vigintioctopunctata]|uniref:WD repeat domain phosphoinositide-interacting protein 2 n=1 Tax=Henosepilachna vigintioctopunctata TaxID=420089 RepID=A0AAW1V310_9CUCU